MRTWGRWVLIFIGVVIIIGVYNNLSGNTARWREEREASNATATAVVRTSAEQASAAQRPTGTQLTVKPPAVPPTPTAQPRIGEIVRVGDVNWKIVSAEPLGQTITDRYGDTRTTTGTFLKLSLEIENEADEPLDYLTPRIQDGRGREWSYFTHESSLIEPDQQCDVLTILQPGVPRTCQHVYEIATDAADLSATLTPLKLLTMAPSATVDLGL
jgi:hypothetical protein